MSDRLNTEAFKKLKWPWFEGWIECASPRALSRRIWCPKSAGERAPLQTVGLSGIHTRVIRNWTELNDTTGKGCDDLVTESRSNETGKRQGKHVMDAPRVNIRRSPSPRRQAVSSRDVCSRRTVDDSHVDGTLRRKLSQLHPSPPRGPPSWSPRMILLSVSTRAKALRHHLL